jgi:8-hydroxy-5-deazaflavin:NADPH oxidoreductase
MQRGEKDLDPRRGEKDVDALDSRAMDKMKVGILGSGDVGKSFARAFSALGQEVKIGSRSPAKLADFVAQAGEHVSAGTFKETARFGDLLVMATLGTATEEAIKMADASNFKGKVVIDATNPLDFSTGKPQLSIGHTDSLGERVQRWLPQAKVVKAFNTAGNQLFFKPQLPGGPPDMFLCGNDADAKKLVSQICREFGWGVIDIGGIEGSRYLEPMCLTWVLHGILSGKWMHAFKMLHS